MTKSTLKIIAVCCCAAFLLCYLFLPLIAIKLVGIGATSMQLMSLSAICILPIIAAIAMCVCSFVLDGKTAGIVNIIGAFTPLIAYLVVNGQLGSLLSSAGSSASNALDIGFNLGSLGGTAASALLTIGSGAIISIILGIGAAVCCFLSENAQKPAERSAGLGSTTDNDW